MNEALGPILTLNSQLVTCVIASNLPHPSSTPTERNYHQTIWKNEMRTRYDCVDPADSSVTKCMLLDVFLPTSLVTAVHIISLNNRKALPMLGLHSEDIWSPRNGLFLLTPIENKFDNLEVVSTIIIL